MAKRQDIGLANPPSARSFYTFVIIMIMLTGALGSAAYYYQQQLNWFLFVRPKQKELIKTYQFYGRQNIAESFKGNTFIHTSSYKIIQNDLDKFLNQIQSQRIIDKKQAQKAANQQNKNIKPSNYHNLFYFKGPSGTGKSTSLIKVSNQFKNKQGWYVFYYDLSKIFPKYDIKNFIHVINGLTLNKKNQLHTKNISNKKVKLMLKKFIKSIQQLLQHQKNVVMIFDSINVINGSQSIKQFMKEMSKLIREGLILIGAASNSDSIDFLEKIDIIYKRNNWKIRQTKQLLKKELRRYTKVNYPNLMKDDIETIVYNADSFQEIRTIAKLSPDQLNKLKSKITKKIGNLINKKPKYLKHLCELCTNGKMSLSQKEENFLTNKEIIESNKIWKSRLEKILFEQNYAQRCEWEQSQKHNCYDLRDIQEQQQRRVHRSILFGLDEAQIRAIINKKNNQALIKVVNIEQDNQDNQVTKEDLDVNQQQEQQRSLNVAAVRKFKNLLVEIQSKPRRRLRPNNNKVNKTALLKKLKLLSQKNEIEEDAQRNQSEQKKTQSSQQKKQISKKQKTIEQFKRLLKKIKQQPRKRLTHKKNPNIEVIIKKILRMARRSQKKQANQQEEGKKILSNSDKKHVNQQKLSTLQKFKLLLQKIKAQPRSRLKHKKNPNINSIIEKIFRMANKYKKHTQKLALQEKTETTQLQSDRGSKSKVFSGIQKFRSLLERIKAQPRKRLHRKINKNIDQIFFRLTGKHLKRQKLSKSVQQKKQPISVQKAIDEEVHQQKTSNQQKGCVEKFRQYLRKIQQTPRKRLKRKPNKNIDSIFYKLTGRHLKRQQKLILSQSQIPKLQLKEIKDQVTINETQNVKVQKYGAIYKFRQMLSKIQQSPRPRLKAKHNVNIDQIYQKITGKSRKSKQQQSQNSRQRYPDKIQAQEYQIVKNQKSESTFSRHLSIKSGTQRVQQGQIKQEEDHIKNVRLEIKKKSQKNTP